jgi:hypothetical protein
MILIGDKLVPFEEIFLLKILEILKIQKQILLFLFDL